MPRPPKSIDAALLAALAGQIGTAGLAAALDRSTSEIRTWIKAGLPHDRDTRGHYRFEAAAVRAWLVATGRAPPPAAPTVASQSAVASHFGVAPRTIAYWLAAGCPGVPGAYDLAAIADWRRRQGLDRGEEDPPDAEAALSMREKLLAVETELKQLKLDQLRGDLIPAEAARRVLTWHIHEAKAILGQVPDRVLAVLPAAVADAARRAVHVEVLRQIDAAAQALSDALSAPLAAAAASEEEDG